MLLNTMIALAKGPSDHFSFIIFGTISAVDFVIYIVQNVESLKNTSKWFDGTARDQ